TSLAAREAELKATLTHLDTSVMTAESSLPATDSAGLSDAVGRLEALRERARGLAALLAERARSVERDRSVTVDRNLIAALDAEAARLRAELEDAARTEQPFVTAVDEAERQHRAAEADVSSIETHRRRAEADRESWTARADALALALDETRTLAGAERLADIDGVVGTLLELVEVEPGWEPAFAAAAGDSLAAVVVADANTARRAIARLKETRHPGAVIALGVQRETPGLPLLGEPVRPH